MRRKITVLILGIALLFVFIPDYSFADTVIDNSDTNIVWEETNNQSSEPITCEADINPELRETKIKFRGTGSSLNERRFAAHTKLRAIMDNYVEPDYYKTNQFNVSEEDAADALAVAEQATAGLTTDYEKIQAIYELVAENLYYDYDYYYHITTKTNQNYEAWKTKITVCSGYAQVCTIFLNSLDIPCIYVLGYTHAYNAAYDSQNKRWIFFDSTWGSKNKYSDGETTYNGHTNDYFDMSVSKISGLTCHEFYTDLKFHDVKNGGDVNYGLDLPGGVETWPDFSLWKAVVLSPKDKTAHTINIGLTEVEEIPIVIGNSAFKDCSNVESFVIPEGITMIGNYAFQGCTGLTEISLPQSIEGIGTFAFCSCSNLRDITLPNGLESIENSAFKECASLSEISIPDSVKNIGDNAFNGCTALTEISIPEGVTELNMGVFRGCTNLSSLTIPDSVVAIERGAFYGCEKLTDIPIPENVEVLGIMAFYGCKGLTEISIPEKVEHLGDDIFFGCTGLTDIDLPDGLTSIGERAFYGCSELTDMDLPESLTNIGSHAFHGCTNITSLDFPSGVTEIESGTAYKCSALTSVTLGEGVTSIGGSAFYECGSLSSVTVPDSVESIGEFAFWYCTSLTDINIPEGVTSINTSTFNGCTGLTDVQLPESLKKIGDNAFSKCSKLTELTIPETVNSIGDHAFYNCSSLKTVEMPVRMTSLGSYAFRGCSSLTAISIPKGVTKIDQNTFYSCRSLLKAVIPEDVTDIDSTAFKDCSPELCIYCVNGSYAHNFAVENGINCSFRASLEDCEITLEQDNYPTVDKPIKPVITVRDGNMILEEGKDYRVSKSDAVIGETFSTVTGLNNYHGEVIVSFTIIDHRWNSEYTVDKEATCTEDGVESIYCIDCGAIRETRSIPATGHDWEDEYRVDTERGCVTDGEESIHCRNCGERKDIQIIPAIGSHDLVSHEAKEPTCTEAGCEAYETCTVCGYTTYKEIPATGHTWETVEIPAGLLKNGSKYSQCTVCGEKKNVKTIAGYANSYVSSFKVVRGTKAFTAKWKKQSAANQKKFNGYQIRYSTSSNMSNAKYVTASRASASRKITGLKKNKKYYVQVRTYTKTSKGTFYSKWSDKKAVKTK